MNKNTKITRNDVMEKIGMVEYLVMADGRTTIAHVTLTNGFTVRGESSCVDASKFNKERGEQYALEKAIDKIWELEGYLLTDRLFNQAGSNYVEFAFREFKVAGWLNEDGNFDDDMQEMICGQILELLNLFASHGHTGSTAVYALGLFENLAKFEPITPLTGVDDEWSEVGDGRYQNKRCSRVFKGGERFNGQAYDSEAVIFWEWDSDKKHKTHFTNSHSAQPIEFPYMPKSITVFAPDFESQPVDGQQGEQ